MSKLICTEHKQRSMVLPSGKVLHRSGDTCDTKDLIIDSVVLTPEEIIAIDKRRKGLF